MRRGVVYLCLVIGILAAWELAGSSSQTMRLLLSSPSLVANYVQDNSGELLDAWFYTAVEALAGLLLATGFSFAMMLLCFFVPGLMQFVMPIMVTSQVIPLIVLAPFFVILMGIGIESKIAMAGVISFFPIFVNFAAGYRSISKNIHELMDIYSTLLVFRIFRVYFPLSASSIFAGLKVSSTLAVIGAIVGEFSGAEKGLGRNLYISALRLEPELMMSSLLLSSLFGLTVFWILKRLESRVLRWM